MGPVERLRFWFQLGGSQDIARRYFVVNGFDGALTMLGLITGFHFSGTEDLKLMIGGCVGAAVALGISGISSAYLSESAEQRRALTELEDAMVSDLSNSEHANAAKALPVLVAMANGLAPMLLSIVIISPLWLAQAGVMLPFEPLLLSILLALGSIFFLGAFLGTVGGTSWLVSGVKTLLIAGVTMGLIMLL
jgi:predicted membrane protein (TIGR00267 family)